MRLWNALTRLGGETWKLARAWISRAGSKRILYGAVAVASLLFLASIIFDADAYTGLSGRPSTQRATVTW